MPLKPGDKAPDFTLLDQHGEPFTLSKSLKQRIEWQSLAIPLRALIQRAKRLPAGGWGWSPSLGPSSLWGTQEVPKSGGSPQPAVNRITRYGRITSPSSLWRTIAP